MPSQENSNPSRSINSAITEILNSGSTAVLLTLIDGPGKVGAKFLCAPQGTNAGSLGDEALDQAVIRHAAELFSTKEDTRVFQVKEFAPELVSLADVQILFERIQPERRLVVCGAGHVGAALANLASMLGYETTLIDDRAEFVSREKFPDERIKLIAASDWFESVREAVGDGGGVSVAVVTRGHSEDESCMRAVMVTSADYIGLIGSKRRTRIVLERLQEHGADPQKLKRVHAPIGLDIGAVTPEEVALAIMAEIVAVRRGGAGHPLSESRRG